MQKSNNSTPFGAIKNGGHKKRPSPSSNGQGGNAVKFYDYKHFPMMFRNAEKALDVYNDLGFAHEI